MKLQFIQRSETRKVVLGLDFIGWILCPVSPPWKCFEGNTVGHYVPMQSEVPYGSGEQVHPYLEPMIFRFNRKPKRNLGFEEELPVRT